MSFEVTVPPPAPGLQAEPMTAAASGDNRTYLVAWGQDRRIWVSEQAATGGNAWTDWYPLGDGTFNQPPTATVNPQGRVEVYGVGTDDAVRRNVATDAGAGGWSGWGLAGACCIMSRVSAAADRFNRMNVFGVGFDHQLYTSRQVEAGSSAWTGWVALGGWVIGSPAAIGYTFNGAYFNLVLAIGGDRNVYGYGFTDADPSTRNHRGWFLLGAAPALGDISAVANPSGSSSAPVMPFGIFIRRDDNRIYYLNDRAQQWQTIGDGTFASDPAAVAGRSAPGDLAVMALGTDGKAYVNRQTCFYFCYVPTWSGWYQMGADSLVTQPAPAQYHLNPRIYAFGFDQAGRVMINTQADPNNWEPRYLGWSPKPGNGVPATAPCTQIWPTGKVFGSSESHSGCGGYRFEMRFVGSGGIPTVYAPDGTIRWTTPTGNQGGWLRLQADGNLVFYNPYSSAQEVFWSTGVTAPSAKLGFGRDGNLVVFSDLPIRHPVWWSNSTACRTYEWFPGQAIQPGDHWVTCTGAMLTMQTVDGNVLRVNANGHVPWATNVAAPGGRMELRASDGRLAVFNSSGQLVWTSDVAAPGGRLTLEPNGTLGLIDAAGQRVWSTGGP